MKKINLKLFTAVIAIISVLASSCEKECGYASAPPPQISLRLKDAQDRNLLSPTTPGHYDVEFIQKENKSLVIYNYNLSADSGLTIVINGTFAGERTTFLKLSQADQDTIYTKVSKTQTKCASIYTLETVRYNGATITTSGTYYTVRK
ncbi:hypothetical protein [Mucilaginibacter myungsuensis]|uniref:Uncharacterized protein n=1 Tax=Mucilaginibacter myungsuensis TaxID=649104 RepID=A0A929L4W0_9SPHI|nr:hypothetical protein [Mucilaginibacter myungsuensis]MBE9664514.1 hypothetical protein [Mucilaginibacter myungsuensis]MDN3601341.1 hypothetical protein [Mucilaginibacter myungsuensis]